MWEYQARVIRVVDGDTVWLDVDLGFDVHRSDSFRLTGINAPELSTAEGRSARDWLMTQLHPGDAVVVRTEKDHREKYGRYLGTILTKDQNINEALIASGHAVSYDGGKR